MSELPTAVRNKVPSVVNNLSREEKKTYFYLRSDTEFSR